MKIILLLFLTYSISATAQNKEIISYYGNGNIAVQKNKDSVFFYNNLGNLTRLIDLKVKKSISYGFPIEAQNIIFFGTSDQKRGDTHTFPVFLYSHIKENAGVVLCSKQMYYNDWGLNIGYIEKCPDDTGSKDYRFGEENLYQYNNFGQLTTIKGDTIREYDINGNMKSFFRRNYSSGKTYNIYKYHYSENKLIKKEDFDTEYEDSILKNISRYEYDNKDRLKVIKNFSVYNKKERLQSSFLFDYNSENLILSIQEVRKGSEDNKRILLEYKYTKDSKMEYSYIHPNKSLNYKYDEKGNLVNVLKNGKIISTYKYNSNGRLIYFFNGWSEETSYLEYK
ncbi:hypothetical protein H0I23_02860 [Cellulophaga sp. HaHaR_3_176]|uniref:hypothetical protein n=1 Tax=Cellulophaga sp. HaHaR_3_176 TaxID=1942464 RepID=UPI001C20114F|nr:hypothetical protein [Cellulophaga sp. HaHaR_3_176]QWX84604.1 hypothetical protein H0I23_02860 [Cellulophaga sp. HaHaR_3_176]